MISASKLSLARHCTWWARNDIPRAPYVPSAAATAGTDVHDEIEAFVCDGKAGTSELFAVWHREWLGRFVCGWSPEVQIAMCPWTGETMLGHGSRAHRDYRWIPRGWVSGTADLVRTWIDAEGEHWVHVVDWKTGRADYVEQIARNAQMLFLALAFARHYGATRARVELAFVHLEGVRSEVADLDVFALADYRDELRALANSIATAEPQPGAHCRGKWCAAYGTTCPATTGAGRALVEVPAAPWPVALTVDDIESDEHAAWLYRAAREASARMAAIWEALRLRAIAGPIPLGEGRVYSIRESQRETLDASVSGVLEALGRHLGASASLAVKHTTSKAGIAAAVKAAKAAGYDGTMSGLETAILEELRTLGAVRVTSSSVPDERSA